MYKKGFTLSEILIGLSLIGIVAVLVIPKAVEDTSQKALTKAKVVFESKLEQAMGQMRVNGVMAGYDTNQDFLNEFKNYMKLGKTCSDENITNCFASKIYSTEGEEVDVAEELKTGKSFGKKNNSSPIVGAKFANGTTALLAYDPDCTQLPRATAEANGESASCLSILYDVNGLKKPNKAGEDIKMYNVDKLGVKCTYTTNNGTCFSAAFKPSYITKSECESLKDSLGITDCMPDSDIAYYGDYDFWAGAVKQCGGVSNLPTKVQLEELIDDLYGGCGNSAYTYTHLDPSITGLMCSNVQIDMEQLSKLGIDSFSRSSFYITSSEITENKKNSVVREFREDGTFINGHIRASPTYAICLE